ncbi:MAG TPA: UpxY family transcription antiterminator [Phycisphaerae bacterium]|nr:UpxY family transcription antiterminator [Phycisphaerae bacterium]HDZ43891.1 UpxY family transcription antiterminator [Phycisphaerae bacterium]
METVEQVLTADAPTDTSYQWYAVNTRSRHEKVVHQALQDKGMTSFLPTRQVLSQWKDRKKWVEKPLFPGYLFVHTPWAQLDRVTGTRGVAYLVGDGSSAIPIPDDQVQGIRQMVEAPCPTMPWPWLKKGKRVRVMAGPLAGLETYIVERKKNRKSYLILTIELLGRSVAVEIDPRYVEVIP